MTRRAALAWKTSYASSCRHGSPACLHGAGSWRVGGAGPQREDTAAPWRHAQAHAGAGEAEAVSALDHRAAALRERTEGLVRRDGPQPAVVVPGGAALGR